MSQVSSIGNKHITSKQTPQIPHELLLRLIADKPSRKILEATITAPRSAVELAHDSRIPLNTIYRRLRILVKNKIVKISGTITDNGKKTFLYQSRIRGLKIHHAGTLLEIEVIPNDIFYNISTVNERSSCPVCVLLFEERQSR